MQQWNNLPFFCFWNKKFSGGSFPGAPQHPFLLMRGSLWFAMVDLGCTMVALPSASWAARKSGAGIRGPQRLSPPAPDPTRWQDHNRAGRITELWRTWRVACGLGLVSQLTSHIWPLLMENLLIDDVLGHSKLDIKLGVCIWGFCLNIPPYPPRAVSLQQTNIAQQTPWHLGLPFCDSLFGVNSLKSAPIGACFSSCLVFLCRTTDPQDKHAFWLCAFMVPTTVGLSTEVSLTHLSRLTYRAHRQLK